MYKIGLIPGDGIGTEVSKAAVAVLKETGLAFDWHIENAGEEVLKTSGSLIPDAVHHMILTSDAVLKGPIGTPIAKGFKSVNVTLRQTYNLSTNMRPVRSYSGLSRYSDIDMVIFRENSEDLYMGREEVVSKDEVHGIKVITRQASTAIAKAAFEYAKAAGRQKVTAVHKANIMKLADGLFLEAVREVAKAYPELSYEEMIVDNMCMQMVMRPERFDVIVTENLYGDILSDLAAGLVGGLGLVPGANIGKDAAIFEAVHGTAPDIAGQNKANPIAMILSSAMMLDYLGEVKSAEAIRTAVEAVLSEGSKAVLTPDLGGGGTTDSMAVAIGQRVAAILRG